MARTTWAVRDKHDREDSATHRSLLEAAERVFETRGFARTTVADITQVAGVSRATFYVYFASKEEAFAALAHQVRDRLVAAQELGETDADDPWAVARATNAAYLDAYAQHLAFLTVLDHQAIVDPAMYALREEIHSLPLQRAADYARRLADAGRASLPADPDSVARAVSGLIAAFAPVLAHEPERRDELVGVVTEMFVRLLGLADRRGAAHLDI